MTLCRLCKRKFNSFKGLAPHLYHSHKVSTEAYYLKFIGKPNYCLTCGERTSFHSLRKGFNLYCSNSCISNNKDIQDKKESTSLKHYGTKYPTQSSRVKNKLKRIFLAKYGVDCPAHSREIQVKTKKTNLARYGVENVFSSKEIKNKIKKTNLRKYGVTSPLQNFTILNKVKQTNLKRYGCEYAVQNQDVKNKIKKTNLKRYGYECPLQSTEVHKKVFDIRKKRNGGYLSKSEKKFAEMLKNRKIEFKYEYFLNNKHWDFAIFKNGKLNTLVEIDGEFNHGLLNDPDGALVQGYHDAGRFLIVPEGVKFVCFDSKKIEKGFRKTLKTLDIDYELWIRKIIQSLPEHLPYPEYSSTRLHDDYRRLVQYTYNRYQRLAQSSIAHFHKSVWKAKVGNKPSVFEAWKDKELLEKVVRNRFIYKSVLSSQNILNGFNVCKLAPKVSLFNPSLAKHLVEKYLNKYETVFDPMCGYSGRMLGVCASGKRYIGRDVNPVTIKEARQVRDFHNLNAALNVKDCLQEKGEYECLFTCPPYRLKETWNQEIKDLSCDQWISRILKRYKCKSYLFVVDNTIKYKDYIVEEIDNASHFGSNKEKVVLIHKNHGKDLYKQAQKKLVKIWKANKPTNKVHLKSYNKVKVPRVW